jgi:hypothetical protein
MDWLVTLNQLHNTIWSELLAVATCNPATVGLVCSVDGHKVEFCSSEIHVAFSCKFVTYYFFLILIIYLEKCITQVQILWKFLDKIL